MSLKKRITDLLFGQKAEQVAKEETHAEVSSVTGEKPESLEADAINSAVLELSSEHQIYRLYNQRRQESGFLPAPRICLDEDGILPPELVKKERNRVQALLTTACNTRLREIKGGNDRKMKKKKDEPEVENRSQSLDASPCFFLSADKLYAWLLVFPPVGEGKELSRDILYRVMQAQGIGYGVNEHLADRIAHSDRPYFNLYLIAQGKPAFDGKNGNIVDNFPRVVERMLEVDEFDQVDYTALNLIHNVKQGQEICRLIKPTEGEPGRSVLDQEIPAKSGKSVPLPKGRNTEISEDGTQLLATIAGSVEFTGRSFQVKPVLEIPGDVDFSTGNLNFLGDINIQGSVRSGFTVRAMGNIHIAGVVEAGSSVEAGGDLVVVKGILGDGTTTVQAHRSVFSKYVENATICVRENIQTDCIIGSTIYCDGEVLVLSGRGSILGGRVWSAQKIRANVVGSHSECRTTIDLGGRPCAHFEQDITQKEVNALAMALEKLECQPDNPIKTSLLSKTKIKLAAAELKLHQMEESIEQEESEDPKAAEEKKKGRLECGMAYPGTKVRFGNEVLRMTRESRQCIVTMVKGEIIVQ